MKRAADILVFAVMSLFVLAACTSEPETIEVTRVVTEVSEVEVEVTREVDEPEDEIVSDGVWCSLVFPRDRASDFMRVDGNNEYITIGASGEWTGVFTGTSEEYWMEIFNLRSTGRVISIGTILFDTIEIDGASGSLELYSIGGKPDRAAEGEGTWVITEGTGELENLQGHGTYWRRPGQPTNYSECGEIDYSVEELVFKSD